MNKYVYLLYGNLYDSYIVNAIRNEPNTYAFISFKYSIIQKLCILHNSRRLNKFMNLPFKKLWFKRALKGMNLNKNDKIYFLLYESFHMSYLKEFIEYLKNSFPNAKFCFIFRNPIINLIWEKVKIIENYLDAIITFNKKDSEKYNILLCENQPYKLPIYKDNNIQQSDVFFIGREKGRLEKLLKIYKKLSDSGLKCDFHIIDVPKEKQQYKNDIVYNKKLSYEEVLARVYASKCVLEILQGNEDYISIRTLEALQYHRKLLTESKSIMKYDFYNPKIIQVFDDTDKIDTKFFTETVNDSEFSDIILGKAKAFHQFLLENV